MQTKLFPSILPSLRERPWKNEALITPKTFDIQVQRYQLGDQVEYKNEKYMVCEIFPHDVYSLTTNRYWVNPKNVNEDRDNGLLKKAKHVELKPWKTEKFIHCKFCREKNIPTTISRNICDLCTWLLAQVR